MATSSTTAPHGSCTFALPSHGNEDGAFEAVLSHVTWHITSLTASIGQLKAHHDNELRRLAHSLNSSKDEDPRLAERQQGSRPPNVMRVEFQEAAAAASAGPVARNSTSTHSASVPIGYNHSMSMSLPLELPGLPEESVTEHRPSHGARLSQQRTIPLTRRRSVSAKNIDNDEQDGEETEVRLLRIWEMKQEREPNHAAAVMTSQRFTFDVFAKSTLTPDGLMRRPTTEPAKGRSKSSLVIDPSSKFGLFWSLFEVAMLGYDVAFIPLQVGNFGLDENAFAFSFMTHLAVIFWTLDMILGFFTGYVDREGDFELRHRKIVKHYFQGRFVMDLTIVSIEWANFLLTDKNIDGIRELFYLDPDAASSTRILRFFRLSRLLKVRKMRHLMAGFLKRVKSNVVLALLGMSRVFLITVLVNHVIACGWWSIKRNDDQYEDLEGIPAKYLASLHWSLSQLGFGTSTVQPIVHEFEETLYASMVSAVYLCLFAYMLGSVVVGLGKLRALGESSEQEDRLRQYLSTHRISWPLKNRIWTFWEKYKKEQNQYMQEGTVQLIARLPNSLAAALRAEVIMPILTAHPFFGTYAVVSEADQQAMHLVIEMRAIGEMSLGPEHELFTEGNAAKHMYFVAQGWIDYCMENPPLGTMSADDLVSSEAGLELAMDNAAHMPLKEKDWLCELALWLVWHHNGWAVAKHHTEILTVDAEKFTITFHRTLYQAKEYARRFLDYARGLKETGLLNDAWSDKVKLRAMAQDVFEPMLSFELTRCKPTLGKDGRSEWDPIHLKNWHRIWGTTWRDGNLENRTAFLSTMATEMKSDCILLYQSLFALNNSTATSTEWLTKEDLEQHDLRVLFLKRLIICMVVCGLKFATDNNGRRHLSWHYPMATSLAHGSRILFQLHNVPWRDFVAWLMVGGTSRAETQARWSWEERGPPQPLYVRRAATHCVRLDPEGYVCESRTRLATSAAYANNHYGLDLPIGGLGNPGPARKGRQLYVGPSGVPYYFPHLSKKTKKKVCTNLQHGHLYMRGDDFGEMTNRQLVRDRLTRIESDRSWSSLSTSGDKHHGGEGRERMQSIDDFSDAGDASMPVTPAATTGKDRVLSSSLPSAPSAFNLRHHTVISSLRTMEDLKHVLHEREHSDLAADLDAVSLLHEVAVKGQELVMLEDVEKRIRASGWLIHLVIECESDDGSKRVLMQKSATASRRRVRSQALRENGTQIEETMTPRPILPRSRSPDIRRIPVDPTASVTSISSMLDYERHSWSKREVAMLAAEAKRTVHDKRVVTLVWCKDSVPWTIAVAKYCTDVFEMPSEAVGKLIDGVFDQAGELYMCPESVPPPTHCHHHKVACGVSTSETFGADRSLPLEYTAVRMKTVIKKEDRHMFQSLLFEDSWVTFEDGMHLTGWEGFDFCKGTIAREWEWVDVNKAIDDEVVGFVRPAESYQLRLEEAHRNLCTLLVGIEASAPLKEDFFGEQHGTSGRSKDLSAFGKRKWRDYRKGGQEVPADLGGMHVFMDQLRFKRVREICENLHFCKPSDKYLPEDPTIQEEKLCFQEILADSVEGAQRKLMHWWAKKASQEED